MKKLLIGLAILVVLLAAVVVAVPFLVNLDSQKERLAALVRERTGRTLTVNGPVSLSILPRPALQLEQVTFSNAPGGDADAMASLERLDLALDPLPLLSGEISIRRLVLVEPEIALEVDAQGRPNWRFEAGAPEAGSAGEAQSDPQSGTPQSDPQSGAPEPRTLPSLALPSVEVVDGRLSWSDARTGARYQVADLDATLSAPAMDVPATIEAGFEYGGRSVSLEAEGAEFGALLAGEPTALSLEAGADALRVAFDGRVAAGTAPSAAGRVSVAAPSAAEAAAWLGAGTAEIPEGELSILGELAAEPTRIALSGATMELAGERVQGDLAVALDGPRPAVSGQLALGRVDLDRLRAAAGTAQPSEAAPSEAAPAAPPAQTEAPAQARAPVPIDLGFLRAVDADLDLAADAIASSGVESGPTSLSVDLSAGRLALVLGDTPLLDGTVAARALLDGSADVPRAELDLRLSAVQAHPLLVALADFDRLSGTMQGTAALRAAGASDEAMLADLDGTGSLLFTDGAVEGVNIAAMLRNALATVRGEPAPDGEAPPRTDFAELGAGFEVVDGVARTGDLRMLAPLVRMSGEGSVDLRAGTVDMRLTPRLVADIEGQGGREDRSGLAVPILVRGTFDDLSFAPDLAALAREAVRDPAAIGRQVDQLRDAVEGGRPEDAVRRLLEGLGGAPAGDVPAGGAPAEGAAGEAPAAPADPLQTLRGLFNR
jgi:AsmA protein